MTIRPTYKLPLHATPISRLVVDDDGRTLATAETREEAEQVKRAFEQVLAPRFTRDEAIAIVKEAIPLSPWADVTGPSIEMVRGIRLALEALAAAGVFSDWPCRHETGEVECVGPCTCGTMADKLDAAGARSTNTRRSLPRSVRSGSAESAAVWWQVAQRRARAVRGPDGATRDGCINTPFGVKNTSGGIMNKLLAAPRWQDHPRVDCRCGVTYPCHHNWCPGCGRQTPTEERLVTRENEARARGA